MNYFEKVNKLLNNGWKMTDQYCPKCSTAYMVNKTKDLLKCANCDETKQCAVDNAPLTRDESNKSPIFYLNLFIKFL
jgi:uncharacterized Zn finger protein (UPF0148 family)